ncbi:MAG: anti-sigma factor family protein [Gammaproteobacteria bacterium]
MTCHETDNTVSAYFDESIGVQAREAVDAHLHTCAVCTAAVADAKAVGAHLRQWQDEAVPQWQRVPSQLHAKPKQDKPRFSFWGQWAPLASAFMLALAVLFNVQFDVSDNGFNVSFGANNGVDAESIALQLAQFEQAQRQVQSDTLQALSASIQERQVNSNAQLLETVIEQFGDSTTRSIEQVMAYFEAQRQEDLQLMEASYQRLIDSDFQTVRSVQQLANYVQYQGGQLP